MLKLKKKNSEAQPFFTEPPKLAEKEDISDLLGTLDTVEQQRRAVLALADLATPYEPAQSADDEDSEFTLNACRGSDVVLRAVEWLWEGRIARGQVAILDGPPGVGKSMACVEIGSRVIGGKRMPLSNMPPVQGDVLVLAAEDEWSTILAPRFKALETDMDRVHFITTRGKGEHERLVALPHDMPQLQRFIEENGVVYVLVDPFVAFLDDATDANKEQEVRRCLYALKQTAEATQAAILCIRHLNKRVGTDAMNRGGGSIGIGAACRCWLTAGKHPENPDVMVLAPNRITAVRAPQAIEYTIASAAVAGTDDKGNAVTIPTATVTWGDLSTVTADQLVGFGGSKAGSKTIAANELILLTLAGRGPLTAADLESAVLAHDIKQHTFENARAELQRQGEIVSGRSGFGDKGKVCWRLKSQKFPREEAGKAHTPRSAHQ